MTAAAPLPIGRAVLDVAARTLAGPDRTVRLPTQAVALLAHLVAHPGVVVRWGEAIEAIYGAGPWHARDPYGTVVARLVLARRALHETGAGTGIETVRGVGVRLRVPGRGEATPVAGAPPREAA